MQFTVSVACDHQSCCGSAIEIHHLSNLTQMSNPQRLAESLRTTGTQATQKYIYNPFLTDSNNKHSKKKTEACKLSLTDLGWFHIYLASVREHLTSGILSPSSHYFASSTANFEGEATNSSCEAFVLKRYSRFRYQTARSSDPCRFVPSLAARTTS